MDYLQKNKYKILMSLEFSSDGTALYLRILILWIEFQCDHAPIKICMDTCTDVCTRTRLIPTICTLPQIIVIEMVLP